MDLEDIKQSAVANADRYSIGWEAVERSSRSKKLFESKMEEVDSLVMSLEGTYTRFLNGEPTQDDVDLLMGWLAEELYVSYQLQFMWENYKAVKEVTEGL